MSNKRNRVWGRIPTGCQLCLRGMKSVLFVTGLCNVNCFYCPISIERKGRDVCYINDIPVTSIANIVKEIDNSFSQGIAITGGEPFLVYDRVVEICRALKSIYGQEFHIHVYTNIANYGDKVLRKLSYLPIDELRLHIIDPKLVETRRISLKWLRRNASFNIGLEVPALPDKVRDILRVIEILYESEVIEFVNLNEVDVSESNVQNLIKRGYVIDSDGTVRGSYEAACKILELVSSKFNDINIHVCCSCTKDLTQIGLRYFVKNIMFSRMCSLIESDGTTVEGLSDGLHVHPSRSKSGFVRVLFKGNRFLILEVS